MDAFRSVMLVGIYIALMLMCAELHDISVQIELSRRYQ